MKIEIVSHRGANGLAPENTMAAAQASLDLGVDYIEVDVWTSRDHVFYIMHDPTVDRTTDGSGHLLSLDSTVIDQLDAGSWFDPRFAGERVPRLEDFLDWARGRTKVFFDVKFAHPHHLIELIRAKGMVDDCFLWSGSRGWMWLCHEMAPELALKVNVQTVADVAKAHEDLGARIVEVGPHNLTHDLIAACRSRGIRIMAYPEQNTEAVFRDLLARDIDMINLDQPDLFVQVRDGRPMRDDE
ncbi:MAG: glycerophosphodiester phosphodiesterase family protein [Caldilineaceae bacterium]|nr:glycerophosphodiester phosphodiesterase family protein [Caldilineaceae bacterium]